jgi:glyoxylase-like metal-dependent hydrolase (beta-lactamase superfamily II)
MDATRIAIGSLEVQRIEESHGPGFPPEMMFPDLPKDALERHRDWMVPRYYDPAANALVLSVHTWLVRTPHHTVLIDTCVGNHKDRPEFPAFNRLDVPWLDRLAAAGVAPEQVDFVMCTHLHVDHVGWNTRLSSGRWVPTFPNARYLFGRRELEHWTSAGAPEMNRAPIQDSVLPIVAAGLSQVVDDGYCLDDTLTVEPTHGHTAGHVMIRARSGGATGLFTGDTMHNPIQCCYPDVNTAFCEDQVAARAVRRRIFGEAAEHGHLLLPVHFGAPHVGRVRAEGDAFRFLPGAL